MDSQEWAEQFPTVSVRVAKIILKSHGWDDVQEYNDCLSHDEWEEICKIDNNYEVSSKELVDWLGY